ncbi:monomethylamine:corrinoid methyltransferase [Moorella naiadis]|uniref:monomethylamine:corrinoid methyltransferase n=1 Tax=Moorella naiadis (nom. illeg.) TaxID=3093670 RepID=UPI003D9CAAB7
MRSHTRLLTVLDRAENGPLLEERDFDQLVASTVRELTRKYDIKYDRQEAINLRDDLADRLFQAGLELAARVGVYCTSTHRRLTFSEAEIRDALRFAPGELEIGSGLDRVVIKSRVPEDPHIPANTGGPYGTPLTEELYTYITQSYIQEPIIDAVVNGTFATIHGRPPKTHTPWEVLLAWREVELSKAAAQRAGRPGISLGCVENAVTEIGELSGTSYGGFTPADWHHVCFTSELKTSYALLIKVAHLIQTGCIIHDFCNPIYGGYAGGAEGVAMVAVAGVILMAVVNMSTTHSICPTHPFFESDTAPEIVWAISASQQALNRNTHLLTTVMTSPVSGPGTESLLYEAATIATTATVSGTARIDGVRSGAGVCTDHVSGLEARFNAEISHAVAGMSRDQANELIQEWQQHYVPLLDKKPVGQPFAEVYDLKTLRPKKHWQKIYDEVQERLFKQGVRFK